MTALACLPGSDAVRAQDVDVLFMPLWTVTLPEPPSAPHTADDARVYIPLPSGQLLALALEDGVEAWSVAVATRLGPAAGNGAVFVATETGLRSLDATSGGEMWRVAFDEAVTTAPLFDTGWLFVATGERLLALRALDGLQVWSLDLGAALRTPPAPAANRVYLSLTDGRVVAVDIQSGTIVWTRTLPEPPSEILPLDDRLFVGSDDNYLYCLTLRDGGDRWRWRTGGDVVGAPVVDEARVYFMSRDNLLRANDRRQGAQRWSQSAPGRVLGGPMRSEEFVILASLTPQLHAYRRTTGEVAGTSPSPVGNALQSALYAPPRMVSRNGRDAFVMLTRQGIVELLVYAETEDETEGETEGETDETANGAGATP